MADVELEEQPAAAPNCEHHWTHHLKGGEPLSVGVCTFCGEPDWDDLRRQLEEREQAAPYSWRVTRTADAAVQIVIGDQWPKNGDDGRQKLTEESYDALTFHTIGKTLRKLGDRLIEQSYAAAYDDDGGFDD